MNVEAHKIAKRLINGETVDRVHVCQAGIDNVLFLMEQYARDIKTIIKQLKKG